MIPLSLIQRQTRQLQRCLVAAKPLAQLRRLHLSVQERSGSFPPIAPTRPDIDFRISRGLTAPTLALHSHTHARVVVAKQTSDEELLEHPFRSFEEVKRLVQTRDWPPVPSLSVEDFVARRQENKSAPLVFDVRSPEEFEDGHIPGAQNLPLLQNDQRVEVGKAFRHVGPSAALSMALAHVFPKLPDLLSSARSKQQEGQQSADEKIVIYCKRGGLRSQSVAAFLSQHGLQVELLEGGYKGFRTWATSIFQRPQRVCILGGSTGSGKTEVLAELQRDCQVVDLEALAHHKGSVFGHLGEPAQPSSEQFRNDLALQWAELDAERLVFLEDEGSFIGRVCLPAALWKQMRQAPVVLHLDVPFELRAKRSLETYGGYGVEALSEVVLNFQKQMGRPKTEELLAKLKAGDLQSVCEEVLANYDRSYAHHLRKGRDPSHFRTLAVATMDARSVAEDVRQLLSDQKL